MQEAGIDKSTKRLVKEYQERKDMIRCLFRLQQVGFAV